LGFELIHVGGGAFMVGLGLGGHHGYVIYGDYGLLRLGNDVDSFDTSIGMLRQKL
jgi:hypothetical protein